MSIYSRKILGFNGMRGVCVLVVFLSHKCDLKFFAAAMGVWAFLIISGFLIVGELHRARLEVEAGGYGFVDAFQTFLLKRAFRIFPAYYALLIMLFVMNYAFKIPESASGFAWHLTYLSNFYIAFFNEHPGSQFGVLWTLSVEQQFYLIAPIIFLASPARWHVRLCALAVIIAIIGEIMMYMRLVPAGAIYLTGPWNYALIILGGAAGILMLREQNRTIFQRPLILWIALTVIAAYGASWIVLRTNDPPVAFPTFVVGFALTLLIAWIYSNQTSWLVAALEWRPLEYLGVISYGFYLVHNFVPSRSIVNFLGSGTPSVAAQIAGTSISFLISVLIAHLSWRNFEKPLLSMRKRLLPVQNMTPPASANFTKI